MSTAGLLGVFGLALLDCINPSAIVATLFLMTRPRFAANVSAYLAGVFVTYLAFGVAVLLGLEAAWAFLDTRAGHIAMAVIGGALLAYAIFAPEPKTAAEGPPLARRRDHNLIGVALLGGAVTFAELSTALPYLGALAIIANEEATLPVIAIVLVVYNLVFLGPPILLSALFLLLGERVRPAFQRFGERISKGARTAMLWLMGIAGFWLLRYGLAMLGVDILGWARIPLPGG